MFGTSRQTKNACQNPLMRFLDCKRQFIGWSSHTSHVTCRKLRAVPQQQMMAELSTDRLEQVPPFTFSTVNCFGPFYIREGPKEMKRYRVLFTCMASCALTTDSFLNAYRCFVCRRGPSQLTNEFWQHGRKSYLCLQTRHKWTTPQKNLNEGDIVILKDDSVPRNSRKLAWRLLTRMQTAMYERLRWQQQINPDSACVSHFERPISGLILLISRKEQKRPGIPS